jgi:hypothetical protein
MSRARASSITASLTSRLMLLVIPHVLQHGGDEQRVTLGVAVQQPDQFFLHRGR